MRQVSLRCFTFSVTCSLLCADYAYAQPLPDNRWYVNAAVTPPGGPGTSWGTAFSYLQDALEAAVDPAETDEIWVAQGTYYPPDGLTPPPPDPRDAFFSLKVDIRIYAGFLTGDTLRTQRNPQKNVTILSGDLDHNGLPSAGDSWTVVMADQSIGSGFVDGFRVQHGGTGMVVSSSSPIIQRCTFFKNSTGGVMVANFGSPVPPPPTAQFIGCAFLGNHSYYRGGGIEVRLQASVILVNCLFSGNTAEFGGGALALTSGTNATIRNCTFSLNISTEQSDGSDGSGFEPPCPAGTVTLHNNILWQNGITEQDQIDVACLNIPSPTHNCIQGLTLLHGPGNIPFSPQLCDADGIDGVAGTLDDNLRLSDLSPCLDAGDDLQVADDVSDMDEDGIFDDEKLPWDLDNEKPLSQWGRFFNKVSGPNNTEVDMGAYENQHVAACKWDISRPGYAPPPDGNVGNPDFLMLFADWGSCPGCGADFNCDLVVNTVDYNELLAHWGICPAGGAPGGGGNAPQGNGPGQGGSGLTLEEALLALGFLSVDDYTTWSEQAPEVEVYDSALLLAALLGGG